jgi:hypothetical protein
LANSLVESFPLYDKPLESDILYVKKWMGGSSYIDKRVEVASVYDAAILASQKGIKCDGSDETGTMQDILAAVPSTGSANGIKIQLPPGLLKVSDNLTFKNNTWIDGAGWGMVSSGPVPATTIQSTANLPILSPSDNPSWGLKLSNLALWGTANTGSKGLYASTPLNAAVLRDVFLNNFGDHAIHIVSGVGGQLENVFVQNALMVRTGRSAYIGAVDVGATDVVWFNVQSTASITLTTGQIGDGFIAGIVNRGTNSFMQACIGHISQVGIVLVGDLIRCIGNRADLNQGNGFVNAGGQNDIALNLSYRNSRTANNTYAGFKNLIANNTFLGNRSVDIAGDTVFMKYGFEDTSTASSGVDASANRYSENRSFLHATAERSFSGGTVKYWNGVVV